MNVSKITGLLGLDIGTIGHPWCVCARVDLAAIVPLVHETIRALES